MPIDGKERVILGDLSILAEGDAGGGRRGEPGDQGRQRCTGPQAPPGGDAAAHPGWAAVIPSSVIVHLREPAICQSPDNWQNTSDRAPR